MSVRKRLSLVSLIAVCLTGTGASAVAISVSYTYDLSGRVATAFYSNGVCVIYAYDANGNRTAQTNTNAAGATSAVWGAGVWGCFPWTLKVAASSPRPVVVAQTAQYAEPSARGRR